MLTKSGLLNKIILFLQKLQTLKVSQVSNMVYIIIFQPITYFYLYKNSA